MIKPGGSTFPAPPATTIPCGLLGQVSTTSLPDSAKSASPTTLTSWQSSRLIGFTLVLLEARGLLPAIFDLSLVPTFLVPLYMISHLICIAQARSWKAGSERPSQTMRPARDP